METHALPTKRPVDDAHQRDAEEPEGCRPEEDGCGESDDAEHVSDDLGVCDARDGAVGGVDEVQVRGDA